MDADSQATLGDPHETSERLRSVTTLCVESLLIQGLDVPTIRRTVLGIASRAIGDLAIDDYEEESHTAVVQRAIDDVLARRGWSD